MREAAPRIPGGAPHSWRRNLGRRGATPLKQGSVSGRGEAPSPGAGNARHRLGRFRSRPPTWVLHTGTARADLTGLGRGANLRLVKYVSKRVNKRQLPSVCVLEKRGPVSSRV